MIVVITEGMLQHPCTFEQEAYLEFISHANSTVHLHAFITDPGSYLT